MLAPHTALTFGKAGALLIHAGKCIYCSPPRISHANSIGVGDAFAAAYLRHLLNRESAGNCLRFAMAAAASNAATLRPGFYKYIGDRLTRPQRDCDFYITQFDRGT